MIPTIEVADQPGAPVKVDDTRQRLIARGVIGALVGLLAGLIMIAYRMHVETMRLLNPGVYDSSKQSQP